MKPRAISAKPSTLNSDNARRRRGEIHSPCSVNKHTATTICNINNPRAVIPNPRDSSSSVANVSAVTAVCAPPNIAARNTGTVNTYVSTRGILTERRRISRTSNVRSLLTRRQTVQQINGPITCTLGSLCFRGPLAQPTGFHPWEDARVAISPGTPTSCSRLGHSDSALRVRSYPRSQFDKNKREQ